MNEFLERFWQHSRLILNEKQILSFNEELSAVILAVNEQNFDRFIALKEFREILQALNLRADAFSVQSAQVGTLNALKQAKISPNKLLKALEILTNEQILESENFAILSKFITNFATQKYEYSDNQTTHISFFHDKKERLNTIFTRLLATAKYSKNRLQTQKTKIDELKFNVVVTGVINAGKSSLLNALLGKKILGTSNVPETVSLTILSHSDTPFAKVSFWSENELKELGITSQTIQSLPQKSEQIITQNELKAYTSATSDLAPLVKCVTLYENLDLLRDNINIIDTPGIDDAVFLREQLVRSYMNECDMMVHLMNVAQSATQKDVEFLINSIQNSHIARLCVVLTHADLLNKTELREVANYTLDSIKKRLNDANLSEISKNLSLFVISSKDFYDGKDESGIKEFKAFLYETFFGKNNQKATLSLQAYQNELSQICACELDSVSKKIQNLSSSNVELVDKISRSNDLFNSLNERIKNVNELAKNELAKLDINALDTSFHTTLTQLNTSVKDRLLNEVAYAQKSGKMQPKRASYIVQTALNDGILNIARQKRNEILALINSCAKTIALNFDEIKLNINSNVFNIGEYLATQNINFGYTSLLEKISKTLNTKEFESTLNLALDEFLNDDSLKHFVSNLANFEKQKFKSELNSALEATLLQRQKELDELKNEARLLDEKNDELAQILDDLNAQKREFEAILKELEDA